MQLWLDSHVRCLEKLVDGTVYLKTDDSKEIKVPLERLSKADRDYVKIVEENAENPFLP